MIKSTPPQSMNATASEPLAASARAESPNRESASCRLAAQLLDAVDSGSSAALLEALSRIALIDLNAPIGEEVDVRDDLEREKLELLRALAVQMRLDLHAMLMHICQRIEASRGYLEVARQLAGRTPDSGCDLGNALPRLGLNGGTEMGGREFDATVQNGDI